jgi:hypothetical protein
MIGQAENLTCQAAQAPRIASRDLFGSANTDEFVETVAAEMASQVGAAVEYWMAQFESVFSDSRLTTLGRVYAAKEILDHYKRLTGKTQLQQRSARTF